MHSRIAMLLAVGFPGNVSGFGGSDRVYVSCFISRSRSLDVMVKTLDWLMVWSDVHMPLEGHKQFMCTAPQKS